MTRHDMERYSRYGTARLGNTWHIFRMESKARQGIYHMRGISFHFTGIRRVPTRFDEPLTMSVLVEGIA